MPGAFVEHLQHDGRRRAQRLRSRIVDAGGRIFGGVVEQVEQHLLEQHGVELAASAGRRRGRSRRGARRGSCRARCSARADDLADVDASARFGAIAPDSSRVMSSRLAMKRFSRSASSWIGREQLLARGLVESVGDSPRSVPAAPRIEASGVLQIVRDRGQQRRAQPVGLGRELGAVDVLDQLDALDRERRLVGQRVEQAALLGRQQRPGPVAVDADHADRAAAGAQRQEQPLGAGQRVGAAAGRRGCAPRPIRRRRGRPRRACPRADSRPCTAIVPSSGSSSTTRTFSIEAIWKAVAQSRSSSVPTPASLLAEEVEVLGRPARAGARRPPGARTRAVRLLAMTATTEEEERARRRSPDRRS